MAAPRKKKKAPPFDVTGIDFSVITTALKTGGKMIEQIMNGIQYGSPEVRLLMLEECDFIIECRVCRGLFRALPNFIAHKRVYCCQAYCNHSHNVPFDTATSFVAPQEGPVVVVPTAPEDETHRDKSKDAKSGLNNDKSKGKSNVQNKDQTDASKAGTAKAGNKPQQEYADDKPGAKTRSQQSDKSKNKVGESSLAQTVHQIESGQLGHSKEYALYTAAAQKMEREKTALENSPSVRLTPISSNPCAVFVNNENLGTGQAAHQSNTSGPSNTDDAVTNLAPSAEKVTEKGRQKSVPENESTQPLNQKAKSQSNRTATNVKSASASCGGPIAPKTIKAKGTLRSVTRVVRELRQKKEESVLKEEKKSLERSSKSSSKGTAKLVPALSAAKPVMVLPLVEVDVSQSRGKSKKEEDIDQSPVLPSNPGSLRAVVKRCLTGRPGALRISPLKIGLGERNSDVDSVSEAGSFSDKGEASSTFGLPRQREDNSTVECAMDMDNMRCKICNMDFLRRKSLLYHCQTRHSGQRTIYPCPYCPRVFYYFWGLTRHLNTNHKKTRSDIDRMRKGLRRKAYKQNVMDDSVVGIKRSPTKSPEDRAKDAVPRKPRPSAPARKVVAVSKSTPSTQEEVSRTPQPMVQLSGRRRRVEVITSVHTKSKKPANVYRKVYPNKRTSLPAGSSQSDSLLSPYKDSVKRTRRIVAKALRTTRSKRVYNRTGAESPSSPHTATASRTSAASAVRSTKKQLYAKNIPVDPSSGRDGHPPDGSTSSSSVKSSATETGIATPPQPQHNATENAAHTVPSGKLLVLVKGDANSTPSAVDPRENQTKQSVQKAAHLGTQKMEESTAGSEVHHQKAEVPVPPKAAQSSTGTKDPTKSTASDVSFSSSESRTDLSSRQTKEEQQSVQQTKISTQTHTVSTHSPRAMQTRTKAAATVTSLTLAVTDTMAVDQTVLQSRTKTGSHSSAASARKETDSQVLITRTRSATSASSSVGTSGPLPPSLLHICPHCQRAFGRQISLDSHIKVCSKAKSLETSSQSKAKSVPGPSSQGKGAEQGGSEVKTDASKPVQRHKPQNQADADHRSKRTSAVADRRSQTDRTSPVRVSTRTLRGASVEKSDPKGRSQQKSMTSDKNESQAMTDNVPRPHQPPTRSSVVKRADAAQLRQRSLQSVNTKSSSSRESSMESRDTSKDSEVRAPMRTSERQSRYHRDTDTKASSSRDSSVDSVRTRSSDRPSQAAPGHTSHTESKSKTRSSRDNSVESQRKTSSHQQGKLETDLLTISRQRLSEQLRAATSTRDKERVEESHGMKVSADKDRKGNPVKSQANTSSDKPPTQRTMTTTVLRKNPKEKYSATAKKSLCESGLEASSEASPPLKPESGTSTAEPQDNSVETKAISQPATSQHVEVPELVQKKVELVKQSAAQVKSVSEGRQPSNTAMDQQKVTTYPQQSSSESSQRPRRKRRAPARVADGVDLYKEPEKWDSRKRPHLDPDLGPSDLVPDSGGGEIPAAALSLDPDTTDLMVTETKNSHDKEDKGDDDDTSVTLVEEIWMEKKPGRPTERVKSNRIYVVEPARAGRLTCQDTRKVGQIVDETGLTCLQCDQHFTSVSNLRRHAIRHLGWRRFKCRLCRFCSYNRSECNTHIMRAHPERLRSTGSGGARIDTFITDLNRQAASVRSLKKRQTLDSRRKEEWEEWGGLKTARSGRRKNAEKSDVPLASSSDTSTASTAVTRSSSSRKPATPTSQEAESSRRSSPSTFNISTRNSPRKFDTRPYVRPDTATTLNTRKGSYAKSKVSSFSHNLADAMADDVQTVPSIAKLKQTSKVTTESSSREFGDTDPQSFTVPSHVRPGNIVQEECVLAASLPVKADQKSTTSAENVPDLLRSIDQDEEEKKSAMHVDSDESASIQGERRVIAESQREVTEELVETELVDDNDLMKVGFEEMQTLPQQFMSGDVHSSVDDKIGADLGTKPSTNPRI